MPNNESKTPRTDTEVDKVSYRFQNLYPHLRDKPVTADFARQLELELSTLTEENKKLREELDVANKATCAESIDILQENIKLKSQLAELQADKEMLDWLEKEKKWFQCTSEDADWTIIMPAFRHPKHGHVNNATLRLAITAAMKGTK